MGKTSEYFSLSALALLVCSQPVSVLLYDQAGCVPNSLVAKRIPGNLCVDVGGSFNGWFCNEVGDVVETIGATDDQCQDGTESVVPEGECGFMPTLFGDNSVRFSCDAFAEQGLTPGVEFAARALFDPVDLSCSEPVVLDFFRTDTCMEIAFAGNALGFSSTFVCEGGEGVTERSYIPEDVIPARKRAANCGGPFFSNDNLIGVCANGEEWRCEVFQSLSSSAGGDPHFSGFHGERMDAAHGQSFLGWFLLFGSEEVTVNVELESSVSEEVYITQVEVLLASNVSFVYDVRHEFEFEQAIFPSYVEQLTWSANVFSMNIDGVILTVERNTAYIYPYFDVALTLAKNGVEATGILGRTVENTLTDEEFADFLQYKL